MTLFTLFSDGRFPSEIRDLVWEQAIADIPPRFIELAGGFEDTIRTVDGDVLSVEYGFVSKAVIPVLLQVCSRSRELAKKRWTLTFDSKYKLTSGNGGDVPELEAIPRTWFDFKSDTLVFMGDESSHDSNIMLRHFLRDIPLDTRKLVRNVSINFENDDYWVGPQGIQVEEEAAGLIEEGFPGVQNILVSFQDEEAYVPYDLANPDVFRILEAGSWFEDSVIAMVTRVFCQRRGGEGNVTIKRVSWVPWVGYTHS